MTNKNTKLSETDSPENFDVVQLKQELSGNSYYPKIGDDIRLLHELQVLHHETELQNDELRLDQVRYEELKNKYNDFFEFSPYCYFILDQKGFIGDINLTGATLFGQNRSVMVNKDFLKFISTKDVEIFERVWAKLIETKTRQVCEVGIFRPDGKRFYVRISLSIASYNDEFQVLLAATDITVEKQIEETQTFLLGCNWAKLGKDFFKYLAEYLANALGMDYVCIDRLLDNGLEAETVAIYFDGQYEDNVTYSLKDTPCGDVVGHNVCCFPENVRNLFPRDIVLQEMLAESYAGVTLWGTNGKPVGLIAVIGRKPLADLKQAELILKQVAIRAASELEHRQVEEELKKKDERLHAILESAMDGFWLTDAEGRFIEVNDSYCRMSGYTSQELLKMKISDIECIETKEETESHIQKILENGEDRFESLHRRKDGSVFNVEVSVQHRPASGGQFVSFLHDITKRKQSEEIKQNLLNIVQQERDKLSSLINSMTDEVWFADANKKITLVNPSVLNEFGDNLINTFKIDKFISSLDIFRLDGSPLPLEESPTLRALKGEVVKGYEEIVRIPSTGQMRYREKNSSPVKDDNGTILGAVTVIRDITERKEAELRILQQNAILEGINRILNAVLLCETLEELGTECLEIAKEITGSKFGFIGEINELGLHDIAISNPGWDECKIIDEGGHRKPFGNYKIHGLYGHVIQSGESLFTNDPSTHPNSVGMPAGHPILESFLGVPLIYEGRAVGIIALGNRPNGYSSLEQESLEKIAPVISEAFHRKKAETAFRESEERFSKAFHYSPMGINIFRLSDGRSVNVNEAFLSLTGYSNEEIIGHSADELKLLVNPDDRHTWLKVLNEGNAVQSLEISVRQKSGQIVNALFSISKIEVNGESMGLIQAFDITARKKAEEAIAASENEFRLLTESMPQIVWTTTADGLNTYFNHQWIDYTGLTLQESYGHGWNKPFHPDDQQRAWDAWQNAVQHSADYLLQCRLRRFDGVYRWWLLHGVPVVDKNGTITKWYGTCTDIDEMKNAGDAILHNEKLLRSIIENVSSGVALIDETGKFVVYNPVFLKLFGLSPDSTIKNVNDQDWSQWQVFDENKNLLHVDDHPVRKAAMTRKLIKNQLVAMKLPSGSDYIWMMISAEPLQKEDGSIDKIICTYHDITERKQAEEQIKESEERHRLLSETMLQGVVHQNSVGKIISMNPAAERILGKAKESFLGSSSVEEEHDTIREDGSLFPGEEHPAMATLRTGEQLLNVIMGVFNPTMNEYRWIRIDSVPLFREGEKVPYEVYTVFEDITERKRSEEALIQAKDDWERTFNAIPDLISIIDTDHRIIRANEAMYERIEMRKNQCVGAHCYELMHKTNQPPDFCPHSKLLMDGQMHEAEFYEHHLDGDFLVTTTPLYNKQGQVIASVHVARDITERKKAEDALRKSEEKLKTLYDSMNEGVAIHEIIYENDKAVDYIITDINPAFEKFTGLQYDNVIGKKASLVYGTGNAPYLDIYSRVANGGPSEFFETYFQPMETYFVISVFSPGVGKFATVFNDITERKKKEKTLSKLNQTLSALGKSSQAMIYSTDEEKYMQQVCDIIVNDCGFAMVWIGVAEEDEHKSVRPVACSGFEEGYLDTLNISWSDDTERGRGPTGTAIRTGTISMCWDMHSDPAFKPWCEEALKRGYASSIVFPLMSGEKAFGAITIYSREPNPFDKDEIKLLSELASDLAHGITSNRLREAHKQAEEELSRSHSELEIVVKERTRELQITNEMLHNEIKIRVKQEQSLVMAEEKYRTVADFTYNWETWIDPYGKFIYVSPSCFTITGYTVDEFMDDPNLINKIAHPDDREMVEKHYHEEHEPTASNWSIDFRIIARNGTERWIGHSCRPVFSSEGKWLGQRGSNRDITEQKKAEKILIDSKNHLRQLTQRLDAIAEEERIRISREIHDELGHLLTALKFDIEDLNAKSDLTIETIKIELEGMVSMVEALIDSVRKIATELRPGILDHLGLFPAIEWKIKEFQMRNKICCEYSIGERVGNFDKNETTIIYRILQEIFTNVVRHSKADKIWISINKEDGIFVLSVTDNGVGFEINEPNQFGSLGLMGMRERALSIGGEIQIESALGKGTTVRFLLKKD